MSTVPWAIQGEEKAKFDKIFFSLGPINNKLSGDRVKPVLLNSKLPVDLLGAVWELSDIDKDGQLDQDEFCVAMHIVYQALENKPVPKQLPLNLVPLSKRKPGAGLALPGAVPVLPMVPIPTTSKMSQKVTKPSATPVIDIMSNMSILSPQHSTANSISSTLLQPTSLLGSSVPIQSTPMISSQRIIVPDDEKTRFSSVFQQHAVDGYINGNAARDVFLQSGQPQTVLAHVWNMCDEQKLGKLTLDQFTLAMHFIMLKVKGLEIPDMLPYSSKDSGYGDNKDSGNISDGSSGVGEFSNELEALNKEIGDLRKEKEKLTSEIREKEMTIRQRNYEVQDLQDQVDRASTSLSQLESDKVESHDRLDELEQQQLKLDGMLAEVRRKVNDEQNTISKLKEEIREQEMMMKNQEEEYTKAQSELQSFKQEEVQLQQRLEAGKAQSAGITKQIDETQNEIRKAISQIEYLKEQEKTVSSNIEQYDKAVTALKNDTNEIKLDTLSEVNNSTSPISEDIFSKNEDPFKSADPFGAANNDPFSDSGEPSTDKYAAFSSDPFGGISTNTEIKNDFFSDGATSDPFENKAGEDDLFSKTHDVFSDKSDVFADKEKKFGSEIESDFGIVFKKDPFAGDDPFATETSNVDSSAIQKTDSVSFKTTFDADDNSDFFGGLKNDSKPTEVTSDDPWGFSGASKPSENKNDDFFSNKEELFGTDTFDFGFDNSKKTEKAKKKVSPPISKSEDAQISWAAAQSKLEEERKEKLRLQEEADLQFAIALSKQDS